MQAWEDEGFVVLAILYGSSAQDEGLKLGMMMYLLIAFFKRLSAARVLPQGGPELGKPALASQVHPWDVGGHGRDACILQDNEGNHLCSESRGDYSCRCVEVLHTSKVFMSVQK